MKHTWIIALSLVAMLLPLAGCRGKGQARPVKVYCAAGLRDPIADIVAEFGRENSPVVVQVDYAGSGELLGRMKTAGSAQYRPDVFVAAEESYAEQARQVGLVDRWETIAYFVPVIVVPKGNPKGIRTLNDLARDGVTVALGEPRGPAIGMVTDKLLAKAGLMSIRKKAGGSFSTVQTVGMQVVLGSADAAIIWDATARQGDFPAKLDAIAIPDAPFVQIVICRLNQSPNADLADKFIAMTKTPQASETFRKYGFTVGLPPASSTASAPAQDKP